MVGTSSINNDEKRFNREFKLNKLLLVVGVILVWELLMKMCKHNGELSEIEFSIIK